MNPQSEMFSSYQAEIVTVYCTDLTPLIQPSPFTHIVRCPLRQITETEPSLEADGSQCFEMTEMNWLLVIATDDDDAIRLGRLGVDPTGIQIGDLG